MFTSWSSSSLDVARSLLHITDIKLILRLNLMFSFDAGSINVDWKWMFRYIGRNHKMREKTKAMRREIAEVVNSLRLISIQWWTGRCDAKRRSLDVVASMMKTAISHLVCKARRFAISFFSSSVSLLAKPASLQISLEELFTVETFKKLFASISKQNF